MCDSLKNPDVRVQLLPILRISEQSPPHRREPTDGVGIPRVYEACSRRAPKTSASGSTVDGGWIESEQVFDPIYGPGTSVGKPATEIETGVFGTGGGLERNGWKVSKYLTS